MLKEEVTEQYWGLAWQHTLSDKSKKASEDIDAKKEWKGNAEVFNINSKHLFSPSTKRNSPFNQVRGYRKDGSARLHKGIDYSVGVGTLIVVLKSGKVTTSGMNVDPDGWGAMVEIEHDDGTITRYAHLSEIYVSVGDVITQGTIIGATGGAFGSPGAGNSQGPHLHFEYLIGGTATDPAASNNDNNTYRFLNKSDKDKFEEDKNKPVDNSIENIITLSEEERLINIAKKYIGVPYEYGANGPKSFDCSGFIKYVFNEFGADTTQIPRTSHGMFESSEKINEEDLRPGDLIFIDTKRLGKNRIDHVGMVISPKGSKEIKMIHASSSKGVNIIDDLKLDNFYKKHTAGYGRFNIGINDNYALK